MDGPLLAECELSKGTSDVALRRTFPATVSPSKYSGNFSLLSLSTLASISFRLSCPLNLMSMSTGAERPKILYLKGGSTALDGVLE